MVKAPARPILVVEDEAGVRSNLFEVLTRRGHSVDLVESHAEALERMKHQSFDLVIAGVGRPRVDGMALLKEIGTDSASPPVILVSADQAIETAVEAMREGAFDYLLRPPAPEVVEETVARALTDSAGGDATPSPPAETQEARPIITRNPGMNKLLERAKSVAPSSATVLLQGESGTGKELLARFIHEHSDRVDGPFVAVNCASLPEGLLESELFGHEKGAFTGAYAKKTGKFELADGGTILLDEISEMEPALQAKLLRVLQEGEIDRLGGKTPVSVDARVVATTNRNLKEWVAEGRFRQDLYYRLSVIPLTIPPLRNRPEDIAALAEHFLAKYAHAYNKGIKKLSAAAAARIKSQPWPGNVRELENMIARGVLLAADRTVDVDDLFLDEEPEAGSAASTAPAAAPSGSLMTISEMEKNMIQRALSETEGNRTHAAKILGISVRTLRNKLAEYKAGGAPVE